MSARAGSSLRLTMTKRAYPLISSATRCIVRLVESSRMVLQSCTGALS